MEELKKEIEEKLEEGQFGFKTGRETIAIYVMNHGKPKYKGERIFAFFFGGLKSSIRQSG